MGRGNGWGIAAGLLALVLAAAATLLFKTRWVFAEDGIIEWASALLFVMAACLAGATIFHSTSVSDRFARTYVLLLAGLCALSELSFGARLFGFSMPAMSGNGELDGGQDLVLIAVDHIRGSPTAQFILIVAAVLAAASIATAWRWLVPAAFRPALRVARRYHLITAATVSLGIAVGIDVLEKPWLRIPEESLEYVAAVLLALFGYRSLDRAHPPARARPAGRFAGAQAIGGKPLS